MEITRKDLLDHIAECGHDDNSILKICGWAVAKGLKDADEPLKFKLGDGTFSEFLKWVDGVRGIKFGDFITVKNGVTVLALGEDRKGKFVGFDGRCAKVYDIIPQTRISTENEVNSFKVDLVSRGLYVSVSDGIVPAILKQQ